MPDKAWKKRERDVANYFNGERTPLSGGNGKVTRADVIHDELFIECKLRVKHTAVTLWDDTAKLAKDEREILEDNSIQLVLSSGIPDERAPLGIRVMQHGKDYLSDKPGIITLEQLAAVKKVQKEN